MPKFTGQEPSPRGFGIFAKSFPVGFTKTGKNGQKWEVKENKNEVLYWGRKSDRDFNTSFIKREYYTTSFKQEHARGGKSQKIKNLTRELEIARAQCSAEKTQLTNECNRRLRELENYDTEKCQIALDELEEELTIKNVRLTKQLEQIRQNLKRIKRKRTQLEIQLMTQEEKLNYIMTSFTTIPPGPASKEVLVELEEDIELIEDVSDEDKQGISQALEDLQVNQNDENAKEALERYMDLNMRYSTFRLRVFAAVAALISLKQIGVI